MDEPHDESSQADPHATRKLHVTSAHQGQRLDALLCDELKLSRAQAQRLLDSGAVVVNARVASRGDKGVRLETGWTVLVRSFTPPGRMKILPDDSLAVPVLASGPGWVIVNKPAGVAVHPLREGETGTVMNVIAAMFPSIDGVGEGGLRSGVVHRLDIETSGTLLIAHEQATWQRLRQAFIQHRTRKLYRTLVRGVMQGSGQEKLSLYVARHKPALVRVATSRTPAADVRSCDLSWRVVQNFANATLLEIELGTGFLHQIRATLAHLGHPVLGDRLYGSSESVDSSATTVGETHTSEIACVRPMLHAWSLSVQEARATAPDPQDFADALSRSGSGH
jgi:23S rRNA pseudouridine1911/1915/1917 synthase